MFAAALALALALALIACGAKSGPPDANTHDGEQALVLLLHGVGGSGAGEAVNWGADAIADQAVVLAPTFAWNWNASTSCCDTTQSHDDDTALTALVTARIAQGDIDPGRVYVFGHSNGAFMVWRLLCDHGDVFHAGVMLEGAANAAHDPACAPRAPISVLHVHGTADSTIQWWRSETLTGMTDPYAAAVGPIGSTDQEAIAAGCTEVLRATGPISADVGDGSGSAYAVDGFTRSCVGAADLWRVDNGPHSPTLGSAWMPAVFGWAEAHRTR